ncbi:hypothetical protein [uncultured Algoriphagus sp.]|uniref:hypothetical protein n=1 Tax=uncultured Algoriphagus sp. TaxID=417365 RepID=UPI00259626FA|nr:hypothetical protein [uncultured Algoriphagus sp.]
MKIKLGNNYFLFISFFILLSLITTYVDFFKYLKFSSLILMIPIIFKFGLKKNQFKFLIPFLILIFYSIIRIDLFEFNTFAQILFWLSAISPFVTIKSFSVNLKVLNIFLFLVPLFYFFLNDITLDFSLSSFLASKTSSVEANFNMFSFLYALFFVYWFTEKNFYFSILNLLFIVLTFKRIAFLVVPFTFFLSVFSISTYNNKLPIILILINLIYLYFSYLLGTYQLNDFIENIFNISSGLLTMGRTGLYEVVLFELKSANIFQHLFGHGIGSSTSLLMENDLHMLHNDVLKIYYEGGALVFILFFYFLYYHLNKQQFLLVSSLNFLFLTDNTLIYVPVLFCYFLIFNQMLISSNKARIYETTNNYQYSNSLS